MEHGIRVVHPSLGEGSYKGIVPTFEYKAWVLFDRYNDDGWIAVEADRLKEVNPLPPEPPKGSVVRHRSMSIAFIRPWAAVQDGEANWDSTSPNASRGRKWKEIAKYVVVVYHTQGAERYLEDV